MIGYIRFAEKQNGSNFVSSRQGKVFFQFPVVFYGMDSKAAPTGAEFETLSQQVKVTCRDPGISFFAGSFIRNADDQHMRRITVNHIFSAENFSQKTFDTRTKL